MIGPLEGIRVIELGTLIAAPFASRMLGEFGAEIVKVESPVGGTRSATGAKCMARHRSGGICSHATRNP